MIIKNEVNKLLYDNFFYCKKMLNENKNVISDGIKAVQVTENKFILITNGGTIYEAKLVEKGNINDKK